MIPSEKTGANTGEHVKTCGENMESTSFPSYLFYL